ncbi:hypothetical protein QWJ26_01150 [Streptomyces sp. CSDS2]|uniref:hypothetical protein n=1 Tax=Streptomyces sp. CSDS2 TaxID=3055051 RepID=UPI0025B06AB9|nr:hypothetical protein [Streptomyces sp. CSDS2]MDN3258440.1 hypothetical protein [Streptomyces sp. CSDS2]
MSTPFPDPVAGRSGPPYRSWPVAPFAGLRPALLGAHALAQALAVSWAAFGHARGAVPGPDDHAWWHGGGPARSGLPGPGLFLALVTVAVYLLLPALVLLARGLRRRGRARDVRGLAGLSFAAVSTAAAGLLSLPMSALATALDPRVTADWTAGAGDLPGVLRLSASVGLVLAVVAGPPWAAPTGAGGPDRPIAADEPSTLRRQAV